MGGSVYINQQLIDGYTDRKAVGLDLRYFNEGIFVSSNLDYDLAMRALNIAAVQGMWQQIDKEGNAGLTVNALFDRRAQPLVTLGNALFFQDPSGLMVPVRMSDALELRTLDTLRSYVRGTTAYSTQGLLSLSKPLSKHWQVGGDIRLTRIDAIPAVPDILPQGLPATGNIWGLGGQLIGSNLYSERDTACLGRVGAARAHLQRPARHLQQRLGARRWHPAGAQHPVLPPDLVGRRHAPFTHQAGHARIVALHAGCHRRGLARLRNHANFESHAQREHRPHLLLSRGPLRVLAQEPVPTRQHFLAPAQIAGHPSRSSLLESSNHSLEALALSCRRGRRLLFSALDLRVAPGQLSGCVATTAVARRAC